MSVKPDLRRIKHHRIHGEKERAMNDAWDRFARVINIVGGISKEQAKNRNFFKYEFLRCDFVGLDVCIQGEDVR
jgi:hypothetical protein